VTELLTMAEAAAYLRYDTPNAAYQWCRKRLVPLKRRGKSCLVRKADIDLALDGHNFAKSRAMAFQKRVAS
jgi:hypothetical protein